MLLVEPLLLVLNLLICSKMTSSTRDWRTPLMWAVLRNNLEVVKDLLENEEKEDCDPVNDPGKCSRRRRYGDKEQALKVKKEDSGIVFRFDDLNDESKSEEEIRMGNFHPGRGSISYGWRSFLPSYIQRTLGLERNERNSVLRGSIMRSKVKISRESQFEFYGQSRKLKLRMNLKQLFGLLKIEEQQIDVILAIDDDPMDCDQLQNFIRNELPGNKSLALVKAHPDEIDAKLDDLMIANPKIRGSELWNELKIGLGKDNDEFVYWSTLCWNNRKESSFLWSLFYTP